ncbi:MAG: hypothetical protein M9950_07120 [Thermomicrobiales bacterium]|nr:hypothetical protein [Thermomicrobiales bacterium]
MTYDPTNHATNAGFPQPRNHVDSEPPLRFLEAQAAARSLGSQTAAHLALQSRGLAGVLRYLAARGDSYREVRALLNLTYEEIDDALSEVSE